MCGIIGIYLDDKNSNAYPDILDGLKTLQHRGQDSAGIYTCKDNFFYSHKNNGKVNDVFHKNIDLSTTLIGNSGIGHVRYATTGSLNTDQCQPLYTNSPYGLALVHNGNIVNTQVLQEVMKKERRHINTNSDSELILNLFALKLNKINITDKTVDQFFNIVSEMYNLLRGSYSIIIMINGFGLLAFKDPYGIRPLCLGKQNKNYIISSESITVDFLNYKLEREINAGECIFISNEGEFYNKQVITNPCLTPCIFEYIYFSRPESIINGILVYQARQNMGEKLAFHIRNNYESIINKIDVVMPVPESSRIPTLKLANVLKKQYCEGFIKSSYVDRTFIMPNQQMRKSNIKMKLNTINKEFLNKNVLIVDDSIVRGNTSIELIKMAKAAGAKKVFFASVAPPIMYPNFYGISIPTSEELIAYNKTNSEIERDLEADMVIFNNLKDVIEACSGLNIKNIRSFETSCFDGNYIT